MKNDDQKHTLKIFQKHEKRHFSENWVEKLWKLAGKNGEISKNDEK